MARGRVRDQPGDFGGTVMSATPCFSGRVTRVTQVVISTVSNSLSLTLDFEFTTYPYTAMSLVSLEWMARGTERPQLPPAVAGHEGGRPMTVYELISKLMATPRLSGGACPVRARRGLRQVRGEPAIAQCWRCRAPYSDASELSRLSPALSPPWSGPDASRTCPSATVQGSVAPPSQHARVRGGCWGSLATF